MARVALVAGPPLFLCIINANAIYILRKWLKITMRPKHALDIALGYYKCPITQIIVYHNFIPLYYFDIKDTTNPPTTL